MADLAAAPAAVVGERGAELEVQVADPLEEGAAFGGEVDKGLVDGVDALAGVVLLGEEALDAVVRSGAGCDADRDEVAAVDVGDGGRRAGRCGVAGGGGWVGIGGPPGKERAGWEGQVLEAGPTSHPR